MHAYPAESEVITSAGVVFPVEEVLDGATDAE